MFRAFNFMIIFQYFISQIGIWEAGTYQVVLDTDSEEYGGFSRIDSNVQHNTFNEGYAGRRYSLNLYLPCRSALVLAKK